MKRILLIVTLLVISVSTMLAQKGLSVAEQFDGSKPYFATATRVWVEGSELKRYNLTLYKSITVKDNADAASEMENAVKQDAHKAVSKEMCHLKGRLFYAFLCLNGSRGSNRYVFYRNSLLSEGGKNEVTLVYMEGQVTMSQLKEMFTQKSNK